jgi:hypothetical protein
MIILRFPLLRNASQSQMDEIISDIELQDSSPRLLQMLQLFQLTTRSNHLVSACENAVDELFSEFRRSIR